MVRAIGCRELKAQLGQVLRAVRDQRDTFAITLRGKVVARLVLEQDVKHDDFETVWSDLDEIAREIGKEWPEGVSASDAMSADRRDL